MGSMMAVTSCSSGVPGDAGEVVAGRTPPPGLLAPTRMLLAMVVAVICSLWPAGKPVIAAETCSCQPAKGAAAFAAADVAFVGTLSSYSVTPIGTQASKPATYTFAVQNVYKGSAPSSAVVFSFADAGSCGLVGMETGSRYIVFATLVRSDSLHPTGTPSGSMLATVCDGTIALAANANSPSYLGRSEPPVTAAPGKVLPTVALDIPKPADTTWKRTLAILGGAIVVLGLAARVLAGRRQVVR
jgi:hypothetical protein